MQGAEEQSLPNEARSKARVACLHTAESNVAVFDAARRTARLKDMVLHHKVRGDLLAAAEQAGRLTPEIAARTVEALLDLWVGADAAGSRSMRCVQGWGSRSLSEYDSPRCPSGSTGRGFAGRTRTGFHGWRQQLGPCRRASARQPGRWPHGGSRHRLLGLLVVETGQFARRPTAIPWNSDQAHESL